MRLGCTLQYTSNQNWYIRVRIDFLDLIITESKKINKKIKLQKRRNKTEFWGFTTRNGEQS